MDRKELFQINVEKAVIDIANYMEENSENCIYVGRAEDIRKALTLNFYVHREASGRLKAIGFHTGVKNFSKSQILLREDNQKYYYKINVDCHPNKILESSEGIALLDKRQKKLARERNSEMDAFMTYFKEIEKHNK